MIWTKLLVAAFTALISLGGVAIATEATDLLLVLAADVSRSVDYQKFQLQREGYATAMSDPRVVEAIRSGPHGRIAVSFVEWSGFGAHKLVVDWTVIGDAASARAFGDRIQEAPRSFADRTSISGGIDFAVQQLGRSSYDAGRRVIDISGDGTNNAGRDVDLARNDAVAKGITINGLVILSERPIPWNPEHTNPRGGLAQYYREHVIGGPGAFVMVAEDFKSFGRALTSKLVAEIARTAPPSRATLTMRAGKAR
ncbi:MAG: DUF1194 domain-containing protein [Rhizobiales bacterium]|nr:DUF1194 domain-containing protein [Hyphomicrobiales bacterium]